MALKSPDVEVSEQAQSWNNPPSNRLRVIASIYSFIVLGMNDAAYGALIPYLEEYYHIDYTIVSVVFLAPFIGYIIAASLNNTIHNKYGQLGIAVIAPVAKLVAYVTICNHPPYAVLPVVYIFCGFGNGLEDGAWNAWIGNMTNADQLMGILHGAYGLGATLSPLIATSMITKGNLHWYSFYYLMIGLAIVEGIVCVYAFRHASRAASTDDSPSTLDAFSDPVTWLTALYLLVYTGVEIGVGGWLVTFMLEVRNGNAFDSGMAVVGFWLGLTIGRLVLGFVTPKIGGNRAITCYLLLVMAFELCFWLIPSFLSSAIFIAWLGFFLGPLFPAAIILANQLLPQRLHVTAIGFAAASGSGGGSVLPFAIGAIAQAVGVSVLQPVLLALILVVLILWLVMVGGFRSRLRS